MVNKIIFFFIFSLVLSVFNLFSPDTKHGQPEQFEIKSEKNVIKESEEGRSNKNNQDKTVSQENISETDNHMNENEEEVAFFEQTDILIVGLGDSLTLGVGDPTGDGYIGIIEKRLEEESKLNVSVQNFGKRGQRSDQLLKTLKNKNVRHSLEHADIIFISIGGNDVMNVLKNNFLNLDVQLFEEKSEDYLNNLRNAFQLIREINANAPVYMIGLFNPFFSYFQEIAEIEEVLQIWNDKSLQVASSFDDIHFVSIDSFFKNNQETLLYKDFFHPNRQGYQFIAEKILFAMSLENDFSF